MRPAPTRLWSLLAAVAIALAGAVVVVQPAYACSCVPTTAQRALREADAVLAGRITEVDRQSAGAHSWNDYRVAVTRVFKGTVYADQVIATNLDSAACGLDAGVGTEWVIFAQQTVEGTGRDAVSRLSTSLCSGNIASSEVPPVLGTGRDPLPGASDREEQATKADQAINTGLLALGIGLLVVGAALAAWIGLAWRPKQPAS